MVEELTYLEQLRSIAMDQHGFVTTSQAADIGISKDELSKMKQRKRLERMAHGVYRVPQVAETPYDLLALAVLWTGAHEAALSHETALAAWGGSDINPERINVSVAKNRRIKRAGGEQYVIQHEDIDPIHITWWQQIPIVDVPTAIEQCIEDGTPSYLIQQSIDAHRGTSRLSKAAAKALAAKLRKRDHD